MLLTVCGQDNKTSDGVFDERLNKNVLRFHGTHIHAIPFMLVRKVQWKFSQNPHMPNSIMYRSRTKFHPKQITDIESTHRKPEKYTKLTVTQFIFLTYPALNSYPSLTKHVEKRATSS